MELLHGKMILWSSIEKLGSVDMLMVK
jgi:hypothetical protein